MVLNRSHLYKRNPRSSFTLSSRISCADHRDQGIKLRETLQEISSLKEKLAQLSDAYAQNELAHEVFLSSTDNLNRRIYNNNQQIKAIEDKDEYVKSWETTIKFLEILQIWRRYIEDEIFS